MARGPASSLLSSKLARARMPDLQKHVNVARLLSNQSPEGSIAPYRVGYTLIQWKGDGRRATVLCYPLIIKMNPHPIPALLPRSPFPVVQSCRDSLA